MANSLVGSSVARSLFKTSEKQPPILIKDQVLIPMTNVSLVNRYKVAIDVFFDEKK